MKRLLLPLIAALSFSAPAIADFGEAEKTKFISKTFNIWCGERGNDCEVTFEFDRMRVNGGKAVMGNQIVLVQYEHLSQAFRPSYA